jgi:IclR family transcriptional regulator, acetate operon repressor
MGNTHLAEASSVQSVDRALTILEILAQRGESGVTEIAADLGVHKSTASRLMTALLNRGLVDQVSDRGRYRLGLGLVRLPVLLLVHLMQYRDLGLLRRR